MSRFLDRLERINRGVATSMGFGSSARAEKLPAMALLGMLSGGDKSAQGASNLASIGADGALIEGVGIDEVLKELAKALDKVPWGIRVEGLNGERASSFRERGCDFLAFGPENTLIAALEDENTAYLICVQPDMDERHLRAIEDLPIDAVLLSLKSAEPPLTLQHLITIGSVRGAFSKYLLLEVGGVLTSKELEGLRDIGVDGLVVDATSLSAEELEALKGRLLALPRRQRSRGGKSSAVLPRTVYSPPSSPSREEEEEEEEDV